LVLKERRGFKVLKVRKALLAPRVLLVHKGTKACKGCKAQWAQQV
jgi:hypothetical protein